MVFLRFLVFAVLLAGAATAGAQAPATGEQPEWLAKLYAYSGTPTHEAKIREIMQYYEAPRRGSCNNLQVVRLLPLPLAPVSFNALGDPENGTWLTKIFTRRCDDRVIHNVLFEARNGVISEKGMLPGETRTSLATQETISRKLIDYVKARKGDVADCRTFIIMNTRIRTSPIRNGPAEEWQEEWTTQRCGRFDDVTVDFRAVGGRLENFRFSG